MDLEDGSERNNPPGYSWLVDNLAFCYISKPVSVSETFGSNGFNSFIYTKTSFTDFTKWTVSVFTNAINFLNQRTIGPVSLT